MSAPFVSQTAHHEILTQGKGTYDLTHRVKEAVALAKVREGTATIFVAHTSASLVIFENADPTARADLHRFFERLVPEDSDDYEHTAEGRDDMTSHLRMALTRTSEVIPISQGCLVLGTWQGIYLFEHRRSPHRRTVWIQVQGVAS
ncbi:MAG: secondary thiamine-phosphate synthase enzyme YjbQ [Candidatus Methylacidiphilales bacterium]